MLVGQEVPRRNDSTQDVEEENSVTDSFRVAMVGMQVKCRNGFRSIWLTNSNRDKRREIEIQKEWATQHLSREESGKGRTKQGNQRLCMIRISYSYYSQPAIY